MIPLIIASARENRKRLKKLLPGALMIVPGGQEVPRSRDVYYPFRQNSHFLFLTGFAEPGCALVLAPEGDCLVIPRQDTRHAVWQGEPLTGIAVRRRTGISRTLFMDELPAWLRKVSRKYRGCLAPRNWHSRLKSVAPSLKLEAAPLEDALIRLRMVKTPSEIRIMRKVARISGDAHRLLMERVTPGLREYQVQSMFEQTLAFQGVGQTAYPSIVASGVNAAVLHYTQNQGRLKKGQLLLIDAGGELSGYAADITRTFPVGPRFNTIQRDLYNLVLQTQEACIRAARPGISLWELQQLAIREVCQGLLAIGLLRGNLEALVENKTYTLFYPHGVSHSLGLDVHDVTPRKPGKRRGNLRAAIILEAGNVVTIEPGIYFIDALLNDPHNRTLHRKAVHWDRVDKLLHFGGIRIEDDILITPGGRTSLTRVPKGIKDIEALRQKAFDRPRMPRTVF